MTAQVSSVIRPSVPCHLLSMSTAPLLFSTTPCFALDQQVWQNSHGPNHSRNTPTSGYMFAGHGSHAN
jgi:hypothetical protein